MNTTTALFILILIPIFLNILFIIIALFLHLRKIKKDREYQDENYWTNWSEEDVPTLEQHYENGWGEPWNAPTWDNWGINPEELGDPEPEIPAPTPKN